MSAYSDMCVRLGVAPCAADACGHPIRPDASSRCRRSPHPETPNDHVYFCPGCDDGKHNDTADLES